MQQALIKLYWVTTEFHEEDWFIVAESAKEAARIHEDWEGYNPGDAIAEHVLDIPDNIPAEKGWPPTELLTALGAKFYSISQAAYASKTADSSLNETALRILV